MVRAHLFSILIRQIVVVALALLALAGGARAEISTVTLYDGARGSLPDPQGWTYIASAVGASRQVSGGAAILDTTAISDTIAGYFASPTGFAGSTFSTPALDRTAGYTVTFTLQVDQEDHAGSDRDKDGKNDRAGFSVIVLSSDKRGVEIAFWKHEVWAQADGVALFTHAEGAAFDTTAALTAYALAVKGDSYQLSAGGAPILSGPLRDYTAFNGFPDPYDTPSLLFFGDDSSSAGARVQVSAVTVALAPRQEWRVAVPLALR